MRPNAIFQSYATSNADREGQHGKFINDGSDDTIAVSLSGGIRLLHGCRGSLFVSKCVGSWEGCAGLEKVILCPFCI